MGINTINPATGELIQHFDPMGEAAIDQALARSVQGFQHYRQTSYEQRSQWLLTAATILEKNVRSFAEKMTLEMGKPIQGAIAEVQKCALVCRYYAENGEKFLADVPAHTDAGESFVRYQPLGPILAVMPWNFPFWQVFRFAAPTLMAGNVALLKHASNVPQSALAIAEIFQEAGFPEGVFQTLLIEAKQVARVMGDDRVKAGTLTGSEAAGASLAAVAGQQIKKTVLELGGSDPFIVMESADLEEAAGMAVTARMLNNGQSCIAAKRFIVMDTIASAFEQQLVTRFQALKVGDPLSSDTDLGPLATPAILNELDHQVQTCLKRGAKALLGGHSLMGSPTLPVALRQGYFYAPTILTELPQGTPADQEEFFGPVALMFRVANLDEAIHLANSTPLGLGASAWTTVTAERDRLINELEAGAVFINGLVKSDPRLPFGGIKRSGYGRELGAEGIREFVNIKTVWIK